MKKLNNFGKVFGLMAAAVAVFIAGGCEDLNDALKLITEQKKPVEVENAAKLKEAFESSEVTEINITDHIDGGALSLTVPAGNKTIYIPGGKETALKSLTLSENSHVVIKNANEGDVPPAPAGNMKSAPGVLADVKQVVAETSYAGWATLVIWDHFKIPDGATFDLVGSVRLIFRTSATVEVNDTGKLTGDSEDSIVWHGEEDGTISGTGTVAIKGTESKEIATVAGYSPVHTPPAQEAGKGNDNDDDDDDDENIGGPGPANSITADIEFVKTIKDTSAISVPTPADITETSETWKVSVTEPPENKVYFAVNKGAGQTITVTGADAELVTQAEADNETEVDGSVASDTLAVFTVNANKTHNGKREGDEYDEWYDSQFEGDDFAFTLNVSEEGKSGRTVDVRLRHNVKNEAAVFIARYEGSEFKRLERVKNIKRYTNITDPQGKNHTVNFSADDGTRLLDMLVHVDHYLDEDVEYLVRVADAVNEIQPVALAYPRATGNWQSPYTVMPEGKIRLRGTGDTERVIKHDGSKRSVGLTNNCYFKYYGSSGNTGVGDYRSVAFDVMGSTGNAALIAFCGGALQLEKNIKIEGTSTYDSYAYSRLLYSYQGQLIMKNGAAVRGHTGSASKDNVGSESPIYIKQNGSANIHGRFIMEGGEVSDNKTKSAAVAGSGTYKSATWLYPDQFKIKGGTITGNTDMAGEPNNYLLFGETSNMIDMSNKTSYPD